MPGDKMSFSEATPSPRRGNWSQRLFARMTAAEQESRRHYYDARKRALLGGLRGDVLEIGPGTGGNLIYYPRDARWLGLEPNPAMHPYLYQEARRLGLTIQLRDGLAERLDAADNSFDAVVGTMVLCSISDPRQTLREIRRVLKPGGRFVFVEHVAAPQGSSQRRSQRIIQPLWTLLSAGCHPDRETWATIESAGFSRVELDHFRLDIPIVGPHIAGFAVK